MLLLSRTLRHVRYTKMTKQSIRHSDRKYPFIQSEADVLIDTQMYYTHTKKRNSNMHTPILQYQLLMEMVRAS